MKCFNANEIALVYQHLITGGLLAYPTEAVWGLGCDPFNQQAIDHLLNIKQRPISKGLIVICADKRYIQDFLQPLSSKYQQIIHQSWQSQQQATTWLLPIPKKLQPTIPKWIMGEHNNLAIRVIRHPLIAKICQTIAKHHAQNRFGFLISTSCNPSQQPPALTLQQAQQYFGDQLAYLDGETLGFQQPSQIKDIITNATLRY